MTVLGIDPGTKCGWAIVSHTATEPHALQLRGTWDLQPRRHEGGGMRFLRVRAYTAEILAAHKIDALAYEEVRRHAGTDAAHIYGGITATITGLLESHPQSTPYRGIPVGTIKRTATGRGNADKGAMIEAARAKWPGDPQPWTDHEADAAFAAVALLNELSPYNTDKHP